MIKILPKWRDIIVINHLQAAMPQRWPPSTSTIPSIFPIASPSNIALTLSIVGTIELHKGKPEIKIMSMYQIVVLSSK